MRLAISATLGIVILVTTYLCAWLALRDHPNVQGFGIHLAQYQLARIGEMLDEIKEETGEYPSELSELQERGADEFPFDESGQLSDPWDNPYVYQVSDGRPNVYSYGQDGKPGGIGIYSDIHMDRPGYEATRPTFHQFHFVLKTGKSVVLISLITGVLAAVVTYRLCDPHRPGVSAKIGLLVNMAIVTISALVFAVILNLFHSIPSGH
jgi:hypothetical protein